MSPRGALESVKPAGTQPPRPARASVQPSLHASAFPVSASVAASWLRSGPAEQWQMDSSQLTRKAGLGRVLSHLPSNSVCLQHPSGTGLKLSSCPELGVTGRKGILRAFLILKK